MGSNTDLVRQFITDVQVKGDVELAKAMIAPDFRNHQIPAGQTVPLGRDEFCARFGVMAAAFSDLAVDIHAMVEDGDKVWTHKTVTGTHTGEMNGVPATGRAVSFDVMDILGFDDGRIVEHWAVADQFGLLKQLGLI